MLPLYPLNLQIAGRQRGRSHDPQYQVTYFFLIVCDFLYLISVDYCFPLLFAHFYERIPLLPMLYQSASMAGHERACAQLNYQAGSACLYKPASARDTGLAKLKSSMCQATPTMMTCETCQKIPLRRNRKRRIHFQLIEILV